jgi:mRNA interferase MazF
VKRGELYRIEKPTKRDDLSSTTFPTLICAPIHSVYKGLDTEVEIGVDEGLKHDSSIRCDELISIEKSSLTNFIGSISPHKIEELNQALMFALELE